MKKEIMCSVCKEIVPVAKYCTKCGAVLPEDDLSSQEEEILAETEDVSVDEEKESKAPKKKKKKKKKKVILILIPIIVVLVAIGVGAGFLLWHNSPEKKFMRAIEALDYVQAKAIYREYYQHEDDSSVVKLLTERLDEIKKSFEDNKMEYAVATLEIENIQKMEIDELEKKISEVKAFIEKLNNSRSDFSTAESLFAEKKYVDAINYYKKVVSEDSNYETAKANMTKAMDLYREEVLAEAASLVAKGDYIESFACINDGLEILSEDAKLKEQRNIYEGEYSKATIAEADAYLAENNFSRATSVINEALKHIPDDKNLLKKKEEISDAKKDAEDAAVLAEAEELAAKGDYLAAYKKIKNAYALDSSNTEFKYAMDEYESQYIDGVLKAAESYFIDGKYNKAVNELEDALNELPGNEKLQSKLDEINAKKPLDITELNPINQKEFTWNDGKPTDPFGNTYNGWENFAVLIDNSSSSGFSYGYTINSYCEYRVYGKYDTIEGYITSHEQCSENGKVYFEILADDKIVYSTEVIRKMDPTKFSVDIEGAEYIKLFFYNDKGGTGSCILGDVILITE